MELSAERDLSVKRKIFIFCKAIQTLQNTDEDKKNRLEILK